MIVVLWVEVAASTALGLSRGFLLSASGPCQSLANLLHLRRLE